MYSFGLINRDFVPGLNVNGCCASAKLPAIDTQARYGVESDSLNDKKIFTFPDNYLDIERKMQYDSIVIRKKEGTFRVR